MGERNIDEKIVTAADAPDLREWLSHFDGASVPPWLLTRPSRRVVAYVLDNALVLAVTWVAARIFGIDFGWSAVGIFFSIQFVYFATFHFLTGQTLGKKLLGHRVVSSRTESPGDQRFAGLPLLRALSRETVGRVMNVLLLGVGYFRVWYRSDRVGWHDQIARTRVISVSEERNSPLPMIVTHGGSALLASSFLALIAYVVMFTAYPLREVVAVLNYEGLVLKGIGGNSRAGYNVAHITQESDDYKAEFDGVKFPMPKLEGESTKTLSFAHLNIAHAHVTFKKMPQLLDPQAPEDVHKHGANAFNVVAKIAEGQIDSLDVSLPDGREYHVTKLGLSSVDARASEKKATLGRVWWDNEALQADLRDLEIDQHHLKVGPSSYAQLKPALANDVIANPIDLEFSGQIDGAKIASLNLTGFSKKLHVRLTGDDGEVDVHELTPFHYLRTELPIWNMNFHLAGDLRHWNLREMKGSVGLRNVRFDVDMLTFLNRRSDKSFALTPLLSTPWRSFLAGQQPGFTLGTSMREKARPALADVYFGRPYEKLTTQEALLINTDLRFLSDTADAIDRPIVVAPPPKPKVAVLPKKSPRKPTSVPDKSHQKPTKLPPFKAHRRAA